MTSKTLSIKALGILIIISFFISGCSINNTGKEKNIAPKDSASNQQNKPSKQEEEFNNSGRAKAILDETDMWLIFEDKNAGLTVKYPHDVEMKPIEETLLSLSIKSTPIKEPEGTMGFNEKTSLKNFEALERGEYGEDVDWPLVESKKVKEIAGTFAQEYMVLSRFEVCNISFERSIYFFNNNQQITVTLSVDKESIIGNNIQYFKTDTVNCGESLIWDFEKQAQFYKDLEDGNASELAIRWFEAFDAIVNTISLAEPRANNNESITKSDLLRGEWVSVDDENSMIEFSDSKKIDYYENNKISENNFDIYETYNDSNDNVADKNGKYIVVDLKDDIIKYEILVISEDTLNLLHLPRGNILKYWR